MMHRWKALFAFPILAAVLASGAPASAHSDFGVNLNINLGPPPVYAAPPSELVLIPGTGIYFVPGVSADIFFYDGYWWSPRGPRWYRGYSPRGPWYAIGPRVVPGPLYRVPRDYRVVYGREERIPYRRWEREHGHRGDGFRHGRRGD